MAKLIVAQDGRLVPDRRRSGKSSAEAKKVILAAVRQGYTVREGCETAGKKRSTYDYYKKSDPEFRALVEQALQDQIERSKGNRPEVPEFTEFSEKYLGTQLFRHHLQWVDLIEGREPRDLRDNQRFVQGDPDMVIVNTPPDHGKSTCITTNYVTWRIVQDPNIRVTIVSKTREMACKFLLAIKDRLCESETYYELQKTFAPPGGYSEGSASWTQDRIYVAGRDSGEKDPTVQALGIRGHIYGARTDLVILDDCVTLDNVREYEKQIEWIQKEVGTRVTQGGRMLIIGTRMDTTDLYGELLKEKYYAEGESPWTYLTQPAVEQYADDPKDWVTLWPVTNRPPPTLQGRKTVQQFPDGSWPAKDGAALARERKKIAPRAWSLVFQQEQVADDAVFPEADVLGCIDKARYAGRMLDGQPQHRRFGMEGLTVIAGLDPADVGYTAAVVVGLDRRTGVRWVLDVFNKAGCRPHEMRRMIKEKTERYRISEWRVEKNAFQGSIVQDEDLRKYLTARGCLLSGHFTDARKWDPNFGISSMPPLFKGHEDRSNLIRLPSRYNSEGAKALTEQLITWNPVPAGHKVPGHWDTVLALWFVEIRCRELMRTTDNDQHLGSNEFLSAQEKESQIVIDLDYALQQGLVQTWNGRVG